MGDHTHIYHTGQGANPSVEPGLGVGLRRTRSETSASSEQLAAAEAKLAARPAHVEEEPAPAAAEVLTGEPTEAEPPVACGEALEDARREDSDVACPAVADGVPVASVTMSYDPDDFDKFFEPQYSRPEQMAEYRKIMEELQQPQPPQQPQQL